jgi:transcriptional regulator with XRE-family HTH domain
VRPSRDGSGKTGIGTILRAVREARGHTRERLAVDAGLSVGTLARVELDQSDPMWSTILAIADALDLKLAELGKLVDDARETSGAPC